MDLHHRYRDLDGSILDLSAYAPRLEWNASSKAEEGATGSWQVVLDDPNGELELVGHRGYFIEDDDSEDEDTIIWGGFTGNVTLSRLADTQRRTYGPEARVITVMLVDANSVLARVVMKGADTEREIETDVERMTWLLGTSEASTSGLTDVSTFVDTSAPVNMDAVPYRGTYFGQIVSDCSQQSGKNFYAWWRKVSGTRTLFMWYGKDSLPDYVSAFYVTNDRSDIDQPALEDGTAVVWQLSDDAALVKSYDRQYCGCYLTFANGATYQHNATTHAISAHRDMVTNAPLVKTLPKAQARAIRQLADVTGPDYRVTTRIEGVPPERVTLIKAGMMTQVKGTNWGPDLVGWHEARVVTCEPAPRGVGQVWDIGLELVIVNPDETSDGPPAPPFAGTAFAGLQRSKGDAADQRGPLKYMGTYEPADAISGWNVADTTGPLAIVPGVPGVEPGTTVWDSIEVLADMDVRIHAVAQTTGVYIPDQAMVLNVRVNGAIVGTDSIVGSGNHTLEVDLRDYPVVNGDIISIDSDGSGASGGHGADSIFWTNSGVNVTFVKVGRGETYDGFTLVFEGP